MSGAAWFWWSLGVLIALRVAYNCYMRWWGVTGHHHTHYWDDDFIPKGAVWYRPREGVWYTQPRFDWPVPRRVDERSNPLDMDTEIEEIDVPPQKRRIEREVEY